MQGKGFKYFSQTFSYKLTMSTFFLCVFNLHQVESNSVKSINEKVSIGQAFKTEF